jgi:hypothetical protein
VRVSAGRATNPPPFPFLLLLYQKSWDCPDHLSLTYTFEPGTKPTVA